MTPSTGVRTQQEVADKLGISRSRVRRLEQSGLRKLRLALAKLDTPDPASPTETT